MIEFDPSSPILPRVASGDASAVNECIRRFGPLVQALSIRMLGNRADAEDATQEIFIALWQSAFRYDPVKSTEATFVAMVARRRLIDRKRRISPVRVDSAVSMVDIPATTNDPLERSDEAAKIRTMLNRLSPDQQAILSLAIDHGRSHAEIAEQLSLPLGSVKTMIRRGLQTIRDELHRGDDS
jgi:RNA polymerase sigma factor (sigma-70 family)